MSGRKRKDLTHSEQTSDQGSRPNSAHASGRSTPDPSSSQPTVDPRFSDRSISDPRSSGQAIPYQQRITGPYRSQRSHVPYHTPYPSSSGQAPPNQQRNIESYGGQPIPQATSGDHPGPSSSRQPTIDPHFSGQSITDTRFIDHHTPYEQRIVDPYGDQPIPQATFGGHRGPYASGQLTVPPYFGDRPIRDPHFTDQATLYQQLLTDPYPGQHFPVPQPTLYPSFSGQATPNQQCITGLYRGQPILGANSSGHPVPYSSSQVTVDSRLGDQFITDLRFSGQVTPNLQRIPGLHRGQPTLGATWISHPVPRSNGQSINNGIYTITNVHQKRFVYLEDANDKTPLRGHFNKENRSARWHVIKRVDGEYSIKNVDHRRYANCESRARLDAFVEGHSEEQLWRIQERYEGQYTIAAIDNGNIWMLPDNGEDTPVSFSKVSTDPMCLWTFENAETVAPMNENPATRLFMLDPKLLLARSVTQPSPEGAIVNFTSIIGEAPGLLQPLGAASEALRVVLQMAVNIRPIHNDRKALIKALKMHLATIRAHIAQLEEDQKIDGTVPVLNQGVRGSLETYARELKEIPELFLLHHLENPSLVNKYTSTIRKIDEVFQTYTTALHRFAASTVDQMRQLAQFRQESEKAHNATKKVSLTRPNAYGVQHRECLQGTREKTLRAISGWVDDKNAKNWIFFFLDVAGSGKSTVAKHMAEKWKRENRLLARFFFSRDTTETMSTNAFCSTVANAFAILDPKFKKSMEEFTKRPDLGLLSFEEQFEGLVAGPLRPIGRHAILIIDALDECHPEHRDQLLQTLYDQHSSIPFLRILATGRPERDIKRWAKEQFGFGYTNFIRLEESDKDVELYIKHRLKSLPIAQDRLYPVIRQAEGLFIWARVACDLLLDCDDVDALLEILGKEVSLDYLYKVALGQSMPKEEASRQAMVLVLQMVLAAREPLSIAELEILSPRREVVEKVVTRLGSVLLYQGREDPIRLLHATFREFLTTGSKADIS